jgi:hypothetical protein
LEEKITIAMCGMWPTRVSGEACAGWLWDDKVAEGFTPHPDGSRKK